MRAPHHAAPVLPARLGHGVFETVWVQRGQPLFVEQHWRVFQQAARALGLGAPRRSHLEATPPRATGRWRWFHTAEGTESSFTRETHSPAAAFHLTLAPQRLGSANWDARHKTLSYLTHHQARLSALRADADEAVLLNEHGHLATAAMANLFWVTAGRVHTSAPECGCREGVIRHFILQNCDVIQGAFPPGVLDEAAEIFLTNSRLGLQPVTRWNTRALPSTRRLSVTATLQRAYRAEVYRQVTNAKPPA